MSESLSTGTETPFYPPLSEATENDNRDDLVARLAEEAGEAGEDTPAPQPEPVKTEAETVTETDTEADTEDDLQARNARLARELREQRRKARQLELSNQALSGQRTEQPNEAMEREIATRAQQLALQQVVNQKANDIYQNGVKQYGKSEFDGSVQALNEAFGSLTNVVIDTIVDMPDAAKLLQHLADNPDLMDRMAALPAHKLGASLAGEAAKMAKPRMVSKAPPPIRPIATQSNPEPETDLEKMSMEQLDKMWSKRDFERMYK